MTIVSVAFVPCAPLLVPSVAGGSAAADEAMRAASVAAIRSGLGLGGGNDGELACGEVIVVAAGSGTGEWPTQATWDFGGFGVIRELDDSRPRLPWALGIGAWLLDEAGWQGPRRYVGIDDHGENPLFSNGSGRVSVVAIGDGTARRTEKAPGHLDPRAEPYDEAIAGLLAAGDVAGLAALDVELGRDLMCSGLPVWRWLAAAVGEQPVTKAELAMHLAPYGVGYFVARWSLGAA